MITMKNWNVFVPAADKTIAYQGDHLTRRLEIATDLDPDAGWTIFLDLEKFGEKNTILLLLEDGKLVVDLTRDMLAGDGIYSAQLRGRNGEKERHSDPFALRIADSINAIDSFPPMEPSAMAQLEQRMVEMNGEAAQSVEIAQRAAEAAQAAAEKAEEAAEEAVQSAEAAQTAAKRAEEHALPAVSAADNGKVLRVVDGKWAADSAPSDAQAELYWGEYTDL